MEILSILLILFPTIVLITINFKKNFRDINPLISFIGFFIVFITSFYPSRPAPISVESLFPFVLAASAEQLL